MAHVSPAYQSQPAPKKVSRGSVSKPKPLPGKWSPKRQLGDPPRRVKAPL